MKLSTLLKNCEISKKLNFYDYEIDEITCNSKSVFGSSLFFAVKGNNTDGNLYIDEAVKRGAKVIITETPSTLNVCQIIVDNVLIAMGTISYNFYKPKGNRVKLIGVVGTNGKTTTTFLIKSILENAGYKVGVIGTLGAYYGNHIVEPDLTTPDVISLNELFMNMANEDIEYAIIEYSAHAIAQKRVGEYKFECLVFTNCTQDHLDYFKTFEEYEKTKISIFDNDNCRFQVLNTDDETGRKILLSTNVKTFTYGLENPSDVFAVNVKNLKNGVKFVVNCFDEIENVNYKSPGLFNVYNCLASITVASVLGVPIEIIKKGIEKVEFIPGRMEHIENYKGADIYVDYAHTPDGLENILKSLKQITKGRVILVFGCGGNRDKSKRKIMGKIAGKYADFTVITTDNPRFEEPYQIISEIESGLREESYSYITIQNRTMAIGYALTQLLSGDSLIIAGKGAEDYQDVMGVKVKFSDKEEVKELIAKIGFSGEII